MSRTPLIYHNSVAVNMSRKRKITTCEERVPTPYPTLGTNRPKLFNKYIDNSEDASPELKKAYIQTDNASTQNNQTATMANNAALENLQSEINGIIDRMLERMTSKIESLRKNLLNEITEKFGEEGNAFESFENESESKSDDEQIAIGEKAIESESKTGGEDDEKNTESTSESFDVDDLSF
uniref:Uncharacterized protein n=1 Tax=Panagrolaimus sp. ES5 TaxID=591445 RepID=A0AC34F7G6_9BILA